jgi:preprotein translocase subunit Sec61beta
MGRKENLQMPQSTAGLVRYFEESKESIKIKPEYVAGAAAAIVVIEIILKFIL